jgi:putative ABC transport system permease protein
LVASQIALSLVLLVGAGLLLKSFVRLQSVNAGFDPKNVLTVQLTLPKIQYPEAREQTLFIQRALRRIETLPDVKSAAATINLPLVGTWGVGYGIVGRTGVPNQQADWANVTPNYFHTMGIPLLQGRDFSDRDTTDAPLVVIISAAMARRQFPNENPLGQKIDIGQPREIIGVVGDVRPRGLELEIQPELYVPYAQKPTSARFVSFTVRTAHAPLSLAGALEKEIRSLDKDVPVANVRTLEQIVATSIAQRRLTILLLGAFAVLAVALATVGIYGVVSYSVSQRTHEIGIRMALGAQRGDVLNIVLRHGMALAFLGILAGTAGSLALNRVLAGQLFGVTPTDPITFMAVCLLMGIVALAACYLPARRATKVDPMEALRYE